jgi:NADPH-dependent 2,4-dienoyl-CoA reductase/sulfur reductase-like enzyme
VKLVIVGGVAGGASAAARARRLSEGAEIVVIERGPDVSFANCGLPYHIGDVIPDRKRLLVVTPERLRDRFRLDVRTRSSVEKIDRTSKAVVVRDLTTGREYVERYDKLILAPGAAPLKPPVPGADLPDVFTLRTLADTDRIKRAVDAGVRQTNGTYILRSRLSIWSLISLRGLVRRSYFSGLRLAMRGSKRSGRSPTRWAAMARRICSYSAARCPAPR